jgi:hypothetical protein
VIDKRPCAYPLHEGPKYVPLTEFHTKRDSRQPGKVFYQPRCKQCDRHWALERWREKYSRMTPRQLAGHNARRRKQHARRRRQDKYVANDLLREAVLASDKPLLQIAEECGWMVFRKKRGKAVGDSARLKRAVGIQPSYTRGKKYYQYQVTVDVAERLIKALGIDPWQVGM